MCQLDDSKFISNHRRLNEADRGIIIKFNNQLILEISQLVVKKLNTPKCYEVFWFEQSSNNGN